MKTIDGFPDYRITEDGRVFSLFSGDFMALKESNFGYLRIGLRRNTKQKFVLVHRLVACAYIPNPKNKPQVNHKNGNKKDNRVENLEWVTASENHRHAFDVLGKISPRKRLTEEEISCIRFFANNDRVTNPILCRIFNLNKSTIYKIMQKKGCYA